MNSKRQSQSALKSLLWPAAGFAAGVLSFLPAAMAQIGATIEDFTALPPTLPNTAPPLVMLVMSNDNQLYVKAYTDYSDLDDDDVLETTYKDDFDYYGYFDSNTCYSYNSTNGYFTPVKPVVDNIATPAVEHHCPDTAFTAGAAPWSGNFLNWATMTRMDIVRQVLYGGKRYQDPADKAGGNVILERVLLPPDVHAFAKVYEGTDLANFTPFTYNATALPGVTLCNVTDGPSGSTLSRDVNTGTHPPTFRVAYGAWADWSADERRQCVWKTGSQDFSPDDTDDVAGGTDGASTAQLEFNVRVEVCVDGVDTAGRTGVDVSRDRCRAYPNGNLKPAGLLQQYGENGELRFGLMTGSYDKNLKGGVLRKDIGLLAGNPAADVDQDEIDLNSGEFVNQGLRGATTRTYAGIINTLNRLRISQWRYDGNSSVYADCNWPGIPIANVKAGTNANERCRDWGNPLGEIYGEALRYFSGATTPTTDFNSDDSGFINGLPQLNSWEDPFAADGSNRCANCAVIVMSTGLSSFDADDFASGITGVANRSAMDVYTDSIGTAEGLAGNYFVGSNGTTNNGICTAKPMTSLSQILGFCPELPELEGGYDIAGLALHAHTRDLRAGLDGDQTVTTYAVQLAESLPEFEVDVDGDTVSFVPLCRAQGGGSNRQCTLVNVQIVEEQDISNNGVVDYGKFFVTWEDATWGNDYDMDIKQQLEYCVGSACSPAVSADQIKITTDAVTASAGHILRLGWIVSGTSEDGILDTDGDGTPGEDNDDFLVVDNPDPKQVSDPPLPIDRTYTTGTTSAKRLENPLWYAAKYGGFRSSLVDAQGTTLMPQNTVFGDDREWDTVDASGLGAASGGGPDGVPDNFFRVSNPAFLEKSLEAVFSAIGESVASSTSAAVVSNSSRGAGAIYQAVYYPNFRIRNFDGSIKDSITWVGNFHSLFIDNKEKIREDNGVKGKLESADIDYELEIYWDPNYGRDGRTMVRRRNASGATVGSPEPFENLNPIWSARNKLADVTDVINQRSYSDDTDDGRYIFTWLDRDDDGTVDVSIDPALNEVLDFVPDSFPAVPSVPADADNFRWLGVPTPAKAADVINYARGDDSITGARQRSIDFDGDNNDEAWRLADIIHSSPVVVGAPADGYDRRYGDDTYQAFRQQYENRRQVAYVGSNGGMVHAFNAGFWDPLAYSFSTGADRPLGGELWAYVPQSLLPHMKWLMETNYLHAFYVDGSVTAHDVNIFKPDATHPGGWGTILVVGMRLGGTPYTVDTDGDGDADSDDFTGKSSYVILDITDPEQPPELIAELSPPGLGYTTGTPTLVKRRVPAGGSHPADPFNLVAGQENEWLLVFGSGPDSVDSATSTQNSSVYAFDLVDRAMVTLDTDVSTNMSEGGSFFGNFHSEDWNNDFRDDVVYVGTIGGTTAAPSGKLKRIKLDPTSANGALGLGNGAEANTLHDTGRPIVSKPLTYIDGNSGDRWVSWGTGRYFVPADTESQAQQGFFAVKEPLTSGSYDFDTPISFSDMVDTTDVEMAIENTILMADGSAATFESGTVTIGTYDEMKLYVSQKDGWYRDFPVLAGRGAERNFFDPFPFLSAMLFVTYEPIDNQCVVQGTSYLWALSIFTGTAAPFLPIGQHDNLIFDTVTTDPDEALEKTVLGSGLFTNPVGGYTQGGNAQLVPQPLTSPTLPYGRQSWREIEIDF